MFSIQLVAQEFSVSGKILDDNNNPVAYANILLLKITDSGVESYKGMSSDENGGFSFENIVSGDYEVKVTFMGFKDNSTTVTISETVILEPIILEDNTEALEEVSITVKRPTLKKEIDRLVFNIENTSLSEGNILEVLRSTPGVLILDNNISIKNTTPTVFINDRKVNLSASEITQLLENSPANSIKKVEVITNPPSKYDAESGAVLNIVMSKNLIIGYRGNIFTNYTQGVFPRYNTGINQFYKTNKINIFANYSFTHSKINRDNEENINYLNNDSSINEYWNTKINRNTTSKNHNFNLNFDYFIDDKNTISLTSNLLFLPYFDYTTKGSTQVEDFTGSNNYSFNSNNFSQDDKYNLGFDFDYKHSFKNSSRILLNTHLTKYDYNRKQNVNSDYFMTDNTFDFSTAFNTKNNQETDIFTSQLDYELPIDESSNFYTGIKASNVETRSDIIQFDIDTATGNQTLNTSNTNAFHYDEAVFAAYLSYDKSWEKWSLSLGIRAEQTNVEGKSPIDNTKNKQDYLEWFPTTNLSYHISEEVNLYTNYKRSIERPSYQLLNPFNFFLNDNTIVTGNPNLLPAFNNHFVIGTSIFERYTVEAYYKETKNKINELPIQDNTNNIIVYSPTNISGRKEFGFDFVTYFDVVDSWSVYFVTSFYNIEEELILNNQLSKKDRWSNYSVISNDISFLKDKSLTANFTLTYDGKYQLGFRTIDTRIETDLSIKKKIFKNKGTLSLAFSDLLNEQDYTLYSKYLNQDNSNFTDLDNRYVKLGFSYKFGNTNLETNERTKERKERDRLEKN